jgi:hypothetical protein
MPPAAGPQPLRPGHGNVSDPQNAVIAKISKSDIQTTAVAGIMTDIGFEFG